MQDATNHPITLPKLREEGHLFVLETETLQVEFLPRDKSSTSGQVWLRNRKNKRSWFDRFDLMVASRRKSFIKDAVPRIELTPVELETALNQFVQELTKHQAQKKSKSSPKIELSPKEREQGEKFLKNKNMFDELLEDFKTLGCIGEEHNLLTCWIVANSRLLDGTLAAVVTSQSGAGKSMILNSVLQLLPKEEKLILTRMTPTAFYYQPEGRLKHKAIALSEEVGAKEADLAIRCLLSDGFLRNLVTTRDAATGQLTSQETTTEGPSSFLTTTTVDRLDGETLNRFLRLSANETLAQTRGILLRQRENRSLAGLGRKYATKFVERKHHAAQRLLKPIDVVNPYYSEMSFRDDLFRLRRDQEKYLRLVDTIAVLRQHQREILFFDHPQTGRKIPYIEVALEDIELANKIAERVLRVTLDELRPQSRNLLTLICEKVKKEVAKKGIRIQDYRFNRRDLRRWSGFPDTHIRRYLEELRNLEYLAVHRGGQGATYEYELVFYDEPEKETAFNLGLLDVEKVKEQQYQNGNGINLIGRLGKLVGV